MSQQWTTPHLGNPSIKSQSDLDFGVLPPFQPDLLLSEIDPQDNTM